MNVLWLLVPIVIGIAHPFLIQMCVRVTRHTGEMESAVIVHAIGTVVGLGWMGIGLRGNGFSGMDAVPWWAYLAGAIGVTCLAAANRTVPIVGVATFCALAVAGQLVMALIVDRYGLMGAELREVNLSHWTGVAMLSVGAFLVSR